MQQKKRPAVEAPTEKPKSGSVNIPDTGDILKKIEDSKSKKGRKICWCGEPGCPRGPMTKMWYGD